MTTPPAPARTVRPTGELGLLLPADWWVVPLTDRKAMHRSLVALADRQFGRSDSPPPLKYQSRLALEEAATTAAAAGGRILAISLMTVRGAPLTISLITYRHDPPSRIRGHEKLERVADRLRGASDDVDVLLGEAPAGPVLRTVATERGPDSLGAQDIDQLVVRYLVDCPVETGGPVRFEAVFTSPHVALRDGLLDLFDTLVASVGPLPTESDEVPDDAVQASA
jgi:hypothetical protein